jgi:hypothetical protein
MKFIRPDQRPLVGLLVKRGTLFLALICALAVFLYAVGTMQGFMDSTQLFLLRLASFCALFLIPLCILGAAMDIPAAFRRPAALRYLGGAFAYILLGAASAALAAAVSFILILVGGRTGP